VARGEKVFLSPSNLRCPSAMVRTIIIPHRR
jgi:hypothetical protein